MEYVLLGLLIISLGYIVKITLKYERTISELQLNLSHKQLKILDLESALELSKEPIKVKVMPKLSPMEEMMQSLFQEQELKEVNVAKDFMKAWSYTGQPSIVKGVDNE